MSLGTRIREYLLRALLGQWREQRQFMEAMTRKVSWGEADGRRPAKGAVRPLSRLVELDEEPLDPWLGPR